MKVNILTKKEHEIIDAFHKDGTKLDGFRTLKTRANQLEEKTNIYKDLKKIQKFREKANKT